MATHPPELNSFQAVAGMKDSFPQVCVLGLLAILFDPLVFSPTLRPAARHRAHQILGVGDQDHLFNVINFFVRLKFDQQIQGFSRTHQLHAIVGGVRVAL